MSIIILLSVGRYEINNHAFTYMRKRNKKISGCDGRPPVGGEIWGPDLPPPLNQALLRSGGGQKVKWAERNGERGSKNQAEREREVVGAGTERWAGLP